MRRALLVLAPFGLLALAGVIVVLSGLFYAAIAIWASLQAAADVGLSLIMLVAGLFVMAVGVLMILPLNRLLRRRPVGAEAPADVFGPAEDTPPS